MPYTGIGVTVSERVREARTLLGSCFAAELASDVKRSIRGHIYVTLFGMYERCVSDCVFTAIDFANGQSIRVADLKDGFRLLVLLPQFQGYRDCSVDRSWPKGVRILESAGSLDAATLQAVFPADGSFMRPSQLEFIWEMFELGGDPWPHPRLRGRIVEIVDARNSIAHGSEAAAERGARLSNDEMKNRIDDFEGLCLHIVASFSSQLGAVAGFTR